MNLLMTSGISSYPHHSVSLVFFEILERYSHFFILQPKFIPYLLACLVDQRGMANPNPVVRSKACFNFGKIAKKLRTQLVPFLEDIFKSLKNFFVISLPGQPLEQFPIDFQDKFYVYEALGILLSADKVSVETKFALLQSTLSPFVLQIEEIVSREYYKADTERNPAFATLLSQLISTIGYLSKGFSGTMPHSKPLFQSVLDSVLKTFNALSSVQIIREKV